MQELIAPASIEFFLREGKQLSSKVLLEQKVYNITNILVKVLRRYNLTKLSVKEQIS